MQSKPLKEMTIKELNEEIAYWQNKIDSAPGWGASVGAALEFKNDAVRELRHRNLSFIDQIERKKPMPQSDYLVIVESPYRGDIDRNITYLRRCMRDCFERGEYPFASHMMYTQVLNDDDPDERRQGIEAGQAWLQGASKVVVYTDLGITEGMKEGIEMASKAKKEIEFRNLSKSLLAGIKL